MCTRRTHEKAIIYGYFRITFSKTPLVADIFLRGYWSWRFWTYIHVLVCSESTPTSWWNSNGTYIYVVGCLKLCTVVALRVQRGRIYTSLARKGLRSCFLDALPCHSNVMANKGLNLFNNCAARCVHLSPHEEGCFFLLCDGKVKCICKSGTIANSQRTPTEISRILCEAFAYCVFVFKFWMVEGRS